MDIEVVGRSNAELVARINADIERARKVKELLETQTVTIDKPVQLRMRHRAHGGFALEFTPLDDASRQNVAVKWWSRFVAWWQNRCIACGKTRTAGLAFCSHECHTEWRMHDAALRGYVVD